MSGIVSGTLSLVGNLAYYGLDSASQGTKKVVGYTLDNLPNATAFVARNLKDGFTYAAPYVKSGLYQAGSGTVKTIKYVAPKTAPVFKYVGKGFFHFGKGTLSVAANLGEDLLFTVSRVSRVALSKQAVGTALLGASVYTLYKGQGAKKKMLAIFGTYLAYQILLG